MDQSVKISLNQSKDQFFESKRGSLGSPFTKSRSKSNYNTVSRPQTSSMPKFSHSKEMFMTRSDSRSPKKNKNWLKIKDNFLVPKKKPEKKKLNK